MIKWAASFILGAWCVQHLAELPSALWLIVATAFSALIFTIHYFPKRFPAFSLNQTWLRVYALFAVFLMAVVWAASHANWRLADSLPSAWERQEIEIEGVVASVPEVNQTRERFNFIVEKVITPLAVVPKHIGLNFYTKHFGYKVPKALENIAPEERYFHAGERWRFTVKLKRPHGSLNPHGFDFAAWALSENLRATGSIRQKHDIQKRSDLVWQPSYLIERLREHVKQRIANVLQNKHYQGVVQALVMGDDSAIAFDDWQVLLKTGVTHLMSISGLHITMLSGLAFAGFYALWRRIPSLVLKLPARKAATLAGVIVACLYAFVAGFSVPTQRTFYMLLVFAIALWSGRQLMIAQVLSLALIVVVVIDPWAVNAAGFWLSFGAVALISFALNGRLINPHWLIGAVKTQWAVTIGMLPLLLTMFNQTSVVSPIANAIAIPVVSFIVTPLSLLGSFLNIDWLLLLAYQILDWLMVALVWLNALPVSTWHQHAPPMWTFIPAMLGALIVLLPRGVPLRFLGLFGFLPMLFAVPERPLVGDMNVTVLDVGQGLSVHVQTASHDLIYDAGPRFNNSADAGVRTVLPHLYGEGVKRLDALVVSHDDNDHSGGSGAILKMMPTQTLISSYQYNMPASMAAKTAAQLCKAGQSWLWDQVKFEVLYPTALQLNDESLKDNNKSCVIKVTSLAGSVLLTGDIEKQAESFMLDQLSDGALPSTEVSSEKLRSDVMTVPHHGSKTSSTAAFLTAASPRISIVTAGYLNHFGHPKPSIVQRYREIDSDLYQTVEDGAVKVLFRQNQAQSKISLQTWRANYQRYWLDSVKSR